MIPLKKIVAVDKSGDNIWKRTNQVWHMALCSSLSHVPPIITPSKLTSKSFSSPTPLNFHGIFTKTNNNSTKFLLNAGFNLIEPDLNEDPVDQFRTNGIPPVFFHIYTTSFCLITFYTIVLFLWWYLFSLCAFYRKNLSMEYLMVIILFMKVKKRKVYVCSIMLTLLVLVSFHFFNNGNWSMWYSC